MFKKTSTEIVPWIIIKANKKTIARIEAMEHILDKIPYDSKDQSIIDHIEIEVTSLE